MLEGSKIRLREWREEDLPSLTLWRNDIALQAQLMARPRGSDAGKIKSWLDGRTTPADRLFLVVASRENDEAVGYIQFDLNLVDRFGEPGICLAPAQQGKGYGTEALNLAVKYLQATWGLRKISLRVLADNKRAVRSYTKCGFVECGKLRKHFLSGGEWKDVLLMEIFL
jgi:diamine N-acetyltransferase